ncbi:hypothetical protein WJX72_012473 [[Myrmecia] bisecta]|uniref:Apyrase n=1 Tax=[Myrmecia] bisecta TaxID=41462 RepID=A0AAW1PC92_9CHLO
MRRKETQMELLYRYRGVALVASVPVLLIIFIIAVMPRGQPSFTESTQPDSFSARAQAGGTIPEGEGTSTYAIVFDAGSTGSRVHVYKFISAADGRLELESDTFEQLKPGLSSHADDPQAAAESLKPLLDVALKTVPEDLQSSTPCMLGATAGLRLLPEGKADLILAAVRVYLANYPFQVDAEKGVSILDGADEGAFAWLTLNYLLGHLGQEEGKTIAAIDLGGGSVQQAYAMTETEAKKAPDGYVVPLKGNNRNYHVYVHSYLGYGLMAGRAAVLAWEETRQANPCIPTDHEGVYEYGGQKHTLVSAPDGPSFATCQKLVRLVLKQNEPCGAPQDQCAFSGVWGGSTQPKAFYVSSYFWDRAIDAGIITDEKAITWTLKPADLASTGQKACETKVDKILHTFPKVPTEQAPFMCLDLSFCHTLLTQGFRIAEHSEVTLVKRIIYKGEEIEAAWPLGAAVGMLSS